MPRFLADPTLTTYLLFAVLVAVAGVVWVRRRDRRATVALVVAGGLFVALLVVSFLFDSPREEASRRVEAMARAATDVQPDRFVEHLSKTFSAQGADRERVRQSGAWDLIRTHQVRVAVWAFGHDDTVYKSDDEVEIGFFAKAQVPTNEGLARYVKATFVRDPDGAFRLKTMQFFNPINTKQPEPIPGFP